MQQMKYKIIVEYLKEIKRIVCSKEGFILVGREKNLKFIKSRRVTDIGC